MDPDDLRAFANRDWAAVAAAKREYWAERYREQGPAAARQASTALFVHARRIAPGFPSDADRAADLAHHADLCDRLERAARAFSRR